jgi:DNA-binding transcriptional MocR family regulator
MDDDGLRIDELERALAQGERPALLYTIATFQNPSGRTLSEERRRKLAALARDHDLLVLEDDPYGLIRYEGEPLPTLFELEGGSNVVYASSFSKSIAPGVRVGHFVLPPELAKQIEALAVSTYISPPFMTQATVHEFLRRGNFEPNLERVNGLLNARRDAMLDALERHMPEGAAWSHPQGGYFIWLDLPEETGDLLDRAETAGVTFVNGTDFFADGSGTRSLRLAFSFVSTDEIDEGIALLAGLLRGAAAPASAL